MTLFTETFTSANGTAWNASRWVDGDLYNAAVNIQNNKGRIALNAGMTGFSAGAHRRSAALDSNEYEVNATITFPASTYESWTHLYVRNSGTVDTDNYRLEFVHASNQVIIDRFDVSGNRTQLAVLSRTFNTGQTMRMKVQTEGSVLRVKVWNASVAEPGTWDYNATVTGYIPTGNRIRLRSQSGAAAVPANFFVDFDDVTVTSLVSDTTPPILVLDAPHGAGVLDDVYTSVGYNPATNVLKVTGAAADDGALRAAVVPPATPSGSSPSSGNSLSNTVMGIAFGWPPGNSNTQAQINSRFADVAATGASWIRFDFDWWSVQSNSTSWNWTWLDKLVTAADTNNLNILGLPTYTPPWAAVGGVHKAAPTNPATYAEFCRRCVERYPQVVYWECYNEQNLPLHWPNPNGTTYANVLKPAYIAMKNQRPSAQVGFGGMAPAGVRPSTFLTDAYAAGVKGHFDFMCYHPYAHPVSPLFNHADNGWGLASGKLQTLRDVMVANGDSNIPMWCTEFGYPSVPSNPISPTVTDANAATWAELAFSEWRAKSWTGPFFYYQLTDANSNDGSDPENVFGLRRTNLTHKPAMAKFTAAVASQ